MEDYIFNQLYDLDKKSPQSESQTAKGLINTKWIDDVCNKKPSLIIYFYPKMNC